MAVCKKLTAAAWLDSDGLELCDDYLSELRAKGVSRIYLSNFEFFPEGINRAELCDLINQDSGDWEFYMEDSDIVAELKRRK